MSSRKDEKERLRQERLAQEEAAARAAARTRRFQLVGAGSLIIAVIAIVVVAVITSGGDEDPSQPRGEGAKPPPVQNKNLSEAARAAGCQVRTLPSEGAGHVTKTVKYKSNPPTSGEHDPAPSQDGVYVADNPPDVEQSVHALEHGRVLFQYRAGTSTTRIEQLQSMSDEEVKGTSGYKSLVFQNQTDMPHAVVATSWTKMLSCKTFDDETFDALRAFRLANVDKAPEFVP